MRSVPLFLATAVLAAPGRAHPQPTSQATTQQGALAVGQSTVQRLLPQGVHRWSVAMKAGEFAEVRVGQRGADVALRLVSPSGARARDVDAARGGRGAENMRWLADVPGVWTVEVSAFSRSPVGDYAIELTTRRRATAHDGQILVADSLGRAGSRLQSQGSFAAAEPLLQRALATRERVLGSDHPDVLLDVQLVAIVLLQANRLDESEPFAVRALRTRERLLEFDDPDIAMSANVLGLLRWRTNRLAAAESLFLRAISIRDKALAATDPHVASTLNNLGLVYLDQARYGDAVPLYQRAVSVTEASLGPQSPELARQLFNLARVYHLQGKFADADAHYRRSLEIRERALVPNHPDIAFSLNAYAWNLYRMGRYVEPESLYRRALKMWEANGNPHPEGMPAVLQNLASLHATLGRYADAEPMHRRSIVLLEAQLGPNHPDVASSVNDMATTLYEQGRFDEAASLYERALAIYERAHGPNHPSVANSLGNLALAYATAGRRAEAEPLYKRALEIQERTLGSEHPSVGNTFNNLGLLYFWQYRYADAEATLRRAIAVRERNFGANSPELGSSLRSLGALLTELGRLQEAEAVYRRALAIDETTFGRDSVPDASLRMLGTLYGRQGRYADAESLHRRSLSLAERREGSSSVGVALSLDRLARTIWSRDSMPSRVLPLLDRAVSIVDTIASARTNRVDFLELRAAVRRRARDRAGAIADLTEAIRIAEELRPQIGGDETTRATFFESFVRSYGMMVELQLERGQVARALEYAERGRARVLLDQLAAGHVDLKASIPTDIRIPLDVRETAARARLAEYRQRTSRLTNRTDAERARLTGALDDSLRIAERELRTVYAEIKNASPLWRDLITTSGQAIDLPTMQRRVVPPNGMMLLYQIGDEQSFVFLIASRGAPTAVRLQISAQAARALAARPGPLTSRALTRLVTGDSAAPTTIASLLGQTRGGQTAVIRPSALDARLHTLWRVLVPDSVWRRVQALEEIIIVPGRGMHGIPFEALVTARPAPGARTRYWLDEGPAIRYAASAATLYNLENRATATAVQRRAASVVSLSDPVFDAAPVPVTQAGDTTARAGRDASFGESLARSGFLARGNVLARLPGTAAETEAIRRAFAAVSLSEVVALQGPGATEAALRGALAEKRYVHLATHGLVDDQPGSLFAALAMTAPSNATPDDDGFLQLHEIYQLRLSEAELTVLSACETNVGTVVGGEGVFALSRGFFAAGARRVIASQWSVEDRSTAALIGRLFDAVAASEAKGRRVDYAIALRDAKRAVRSTAGWSHPYFWAPFVLAGSR